MTLFVLSIKYSKHIDVGVDKLSTIARIYIPASIVLLFINTVCFVIFTVVLYKQLTFSPLGWFYVFLPLYIATVSSLFISIFSWSLVLPAAIFGIQCVILELTLDGTLNWDYNFVVIPTYILAVVMIITPCIFSPRGRKCLEFVSHLFFWSFVIVFAALWGAYMEGEISAFYYVLIPVDILLGCVYFVFFLCCCCCALTMCGLGTVMAFGASQK